MSAEAHINHIRDSFKESFKLLNNYQKQVKEDEDNRSSYKGRELLELLQNADDAYYPECGNKCKVLVELTKDDITISNYGKPFTIKTLETLCQGAVSQKFGEYIGCKGIGFRSVLNWSDELFIYSGKDKDYYSVHFSREIADQQFDEIQENIKDQFKILEEKGYDKRYPILAAPQYTTPIEKDFDTVIKLVFKEEIFDENEKKVDIYEHLSEEIDSFDAQMLLFLPHIKEIEFKIHDITPLCYRYYKKENDDGTVTIHSEAHGRRTDKDYRVFKQEKELITQNDKKETGKFAIAIPVTGEVSSNEPIYTFFPVKEVETPLPAILHATFHLNDNRNHLNDKFVKVNKVVFEELLTFYIHTIIKNYKGSERIRLLKPNNMPTSLEDKFFFKGDFSALNIKDAATGKVYPDLENSYISNCSKEKIFFTISEEYLTAADTPVICDTDIPDILLSAPFKKVVKPYDKQSIKRFAERVIYSLPSNSEYLQRCEEFLKTVIDEQSASWTTEDRIFVFKWWEKNPDYTSLPKLLRYRDKEENPFIISQTESCFLSGSITDVPKWAKIFVLAEEDELALIRSYRDEIDSEKRNKKNESDKRIIARLIRNNLIIIQEQSSRAEMISPVNASVENDHKKSIELVRWLWDIWNEESFAETVKKVNFNLPTKNKKVNTSNNIYLGSDYGNDVGEKIFLKDPSKEALEKIDFGSNVSDWQLGRFFAALGVHTYPQITQLPIDNHTYHEFKNDDEKKAIQFVETIWKEHQPTDNDGTKIEATYFKFKIDFISGITSILKNANHSTILAWIINTPRMRELFERNDAGNDCYIEYKPKIRGQKNTWTLFPANGVGCPSFLCYIFSETKWISLHDKKYAPKDLLITSDNYLESAGINCLTEHVLDSISEKAQGNKQVIKKILVNLGAKESILDMSSDEFYALLCSLPSRPNSQKLSREIYRSIIENSKEEKKRKTRFYEDSKAKKKFFSEGCVLAKNRDGVIAYRNVNEVYFSSSAVLNFDNDFFIDVPTRSGKKDDFKEILNVKPFEQNYTLCSEPKLSNCNDEFQKDFNHFLPYLMTYRDGQKDYVKDLNVSLIEPIEIIYNGNHREIHGDYNLFRKKNSWYICVGYIDDYKNIKKERIADALEQIFNFIFNFPAKDFLNKVNQLFIFSKDQRQHLIESDFGSLEEFELTKNEIDKTESLREILKNHLDADGLWNEKVRDIADAIDWYGDISISSQESIVKMLKIIGKDLDYLNDFMPKKISVISYNQQELTQQYSEQENSIQVHIYNHLLSNADKQEKLKECWKFLKDCFTYYDVSKLERVHFNASEALEEIKNECFTKYGIPEDVVLTETSIENIKKIYSDNLNYINGLRVQKEYIHTFTNDSKNSSLMFYYSNSELKAIFDAFVENEKANTTQQQDEEDISNIEELLKATQIGTSLKPGTPKVNKGARHGTTVSGQGKKNNDQKKHQGGLAEYLVILKIAKGEADFVNNFFKDEGYSIKWISGYAKEIPRIPSDDRSYDVTETDDNAGYDIELISKKNVTKKLYIEVKSSSSEGCSFFMSSNEFENAKKLETGDSRYRLAFVTGLDGNAPQVTFAESSVWDEAAFTKIPMEYNIVYTKKAEEQPS